MSTHASRGSSRMAHLPRNHVHAYLRALSLRWNAGYRGVS